MVFQSYELLNAFLSPTYDLLQTEPKKMDFQVSY